ncbi:AzlD domain-containing protein [Kiloniella sp. b19]|uniref:AzlD domain-containing protein n=1 Tax=Kiloniella sp. GXU_MW_B19 TaxID=3141326 RepID=UPI0031DA8A4B
MTALEEILMVLGMTLVTFGVRYALFARADRVRFSTSIKDALGFIPPAVLTAIVVPALLISKEGQINFSYDNPYLIAGILTLLLGLWRKDLLTAIAGGMAFFFALRWLLTL